MEPQQINLNYPPDRMTHAPKMQVKLFLGDDEACQMGCP